jgi:YidC/Oxa1 family membrane protein insertase
VVTLLTKSSSWLGPIASILGLIMNAIYEFFHLFGIQNIALSIIVFTFIVKTLMLPLTIKQQKFTKLSSVMNPELQKIQAKYKGKKDEASLKRQQAETQAVYQKYGASPTSGCLPILITLPIMFALYSVINNIPAYVNEVKQLYEGIALGIGNTAGYKDVLTTVSDGIRLTTKNDFSTTNQIIDLLAKFGTTHWENLKESFPALSSTIANSQDAINKVNGFLGLNIANPPGWKFPGILIPILAMALQFVQGKQIQVKSTTNNKDNPTASAMSSMTYVMPIMSGVFCITLPTGIGLYWIATSLFAIVQQYFVNKYMDRVDVDDLIAKNVEKASKRRSIATGGASLQELARKQTKSIDSTVSEKGKSTERLDTKENQNEVVEEVTEAEETSQSSNGPKSISDIANLLKNRNSEKGDK